VHEVGTHRAGVVRKVEVRCVRRAGRHRACGARDVQRGGGEVEVGVVLVLAHALLSVLLPGELQAVPRYALGVRGSQGSGFRLHQAFGS